LAWRDPDSQVYLLPHSNRARATRVATTCGLGALFCALPFVAAGEDASISAGLPADVAAITLQPGAISLAPWQPVVQRRQASARVVSTASDGAILQLADRRGASGFVVLRAGLASRARATARADLIVARQRLAPGDVRSFVEIGAANGIAYQAGAVRNATGGMNWGVWLRRPNGNRSVMSVSKVRIVLGDERRVQLETTWLSSKSSAKLQIDGREVAATAATDLANVGPNRVNIGLGRPARIDEVGAIFVRTALAFSGAGASAVPATAPAPGGPGVVIPVVGAPGTGGTTGAPVPSGVDQIPGREIARADWETTTPNPYFQRASNDRIRAVASPVAEGKLAGRFEVQQGDNPTSCCGDRSEFLISTNEKDGDERWYTWATLFDDSFPTGGGWQVVTQWHSAVDGVPPMGFYAEDGTFYLRTSQDTGGNGIKRFWETKIQKNVWYRIKLHVKWSSNASVGYVEMWVNGQLVTPKTFTRNMYPGNTNYFKQGYYRQDSIGGTGVVFHDGFRATQVN
jgi:Polysaccharide lyase